jgi:hypothetical protein
MIVRHVDFQIFPSWRTETSSFVLGDLLRMQDFPQTLNKIVPDIPVFIAVARARERDFPGSDRLEIQLGQSFPGEVTIPNVSGSPFRLLPPDGFAGAPALPRVA